MVVRKNRRHIELNASFACKEVDRLRSILDKRINACRIEMAASFVFKIGAGSAGWLRNALLSR